MMSTLVFSSIEDTSYYFEIGHKITNFIIKISSQKLSGNVCLVLDIEDFLEHGVGYNAVSSRVMWVRLPVEKEVKTISFPLNIEKEIPMKARLTRLGSHEDDDLADDISIRISTPKGVINSDFIGSSTQPDFSGNSSSGTYSNVEFSRYINEDREDRLKWLLAFIRGHGHHYGPGITSHTQKDWKERLEHTTTLHEDCLELERRGLIRRHFENEHVVVWTPVERKKN